MPLHATMGRLQGMQVRFDCHANSGRLLHRVLILMDVWHSVPPIFGVLDRFLPFCGIEVVATIDI